MLLKINFIAAMRGLIDAVRGVFASHIFVIASGNMRKCMAYIVAACFCLTANAQKPTVAQDIFSKKNLVAWCIVPFDSKERNAEERAQMLNELGITKLAYDWREKHIPYFDDEIKALEKHKITLQSFWYASGPTPQEDKNLQSILDALRRNKVKNTVVEHVYSGSRF